MSVSCLTASRALSSATLRADACWRVASATKLSCGDNTSFDTCTDLAVSSALRAKATFISSGGRAVCIFRPRMASCCFAADSIVFEHAVIRCVSGREWLRDSPAAWSAASAALTAELARSCATRAAARFTSRASPATVRSSSPSAASCAASVFCTVLAELMKLAAASHVEASTPAARAACSMASASGMLRARAEPDMEVWRAVAAASRAACDSRASPIRLALREHASIDTPALCAAVNAASAADTLMRKSS